MRCHAKWTDATAGQSSYSSITQAGLDRFDKLVEMCKEGRSEEGLAVEKAFMVKLWEEAKITVWSDEDRKKAARRKSGQPALPKKPKRSVEEAKKGFDGLFD